MMHPDNTLPANKVAAPKNLPKTGTSSKKKELDELLGKI